MLTNTITADPPILWDKDISSHSFTALGPSTFATLLAELAFFLLVTLN